MSSIKQIFRCIYCLSMIPILWVVVLLASPLHSKFLWQLYLSEFKRTAEYSHYYGLSSDEDYEECLKIHSDTAALLESKGII